MLLKNCAFIITQNPQRKILKNMDILIEEDRIKKIGKNIKAKNAIDCSNKIVMPGLVNTHTHLGMHSLRGKCDDKELFDWLAALEKEEQKMTEKTVYENTISGLKESIRFGSTTIYDSYKFPEIRVKAFKKIGARGVISSTVRDEKSFNASKKFLENLKEDSIKVAIAANAVYSCSEELLKKIIEYSDKKNILRRIHVGETRKERYEILKNKGKLAIEYLDSIGFLSENTLLVHCIWITKGEIKKIAKAHAKVAHNPVSNMKLSSGGVMPLNEMLSEKVTVGLGTDGVASNNNLDLFEEMKTTALLHRHHKWDAKAVSNQEILDMATIKGAECIGLEKEIGSIEEGKKADIITLEIENNLKPVNDVVSNIIFSANGNNVNDVIINGKIILENRLFVNKNGV
ncbi:MAG TPA: amidohydrolase [archaeon]|nr:amidohydrolase [archaeon]